MRRAGRLLGSALLGFLALGLAFGVPAASTAQGALTQTEGCVSETGTGGACADGKALDAAAAVAVSPDGKSAYVVSEHSNAVAVFSRDVTTGALTQLADTAGCVSETGTAGACVDGKALGNPRFVAVSPDGKSVYVASSASDAVAIFSRNATTGALTQLAGTDGCVSETGTAGACADGKALDAARHVTVSPDGTTVYATSFHSGAVTVFTRNATTGALTQLAGTAGCVSETGTAGACADGTALDRARGIAVSPDGASVYVSSFGSGAVAVFSRSGTTGALTQLAGTDGCVSETGTAGACTDGTALDGATGVAVRPDGNNVYVASETSGAMAVFSRDGTTGALTQLTGTAGCVSETGTAGACADGRGLGGARFSVGSPDDKSVYVTSETSDGVAVFLRDVTTGALTQLAGTAGCVNETGTAGCADGTALDGSRLLAVSPDGRSVYVASLTSDAVSVFSRDETTGVLTQLGSTAPPPPPPVDGGPLYVSLRAAAIVDGVAAANEDILYFDGTSFSLYFDGSDVGIAPLRLDAFARLDTNELLLSFDAAGTVPVLGTVDDSDVVRFTATSLGPTTAGSFSLYFDGSDVGLSADAHDLDAVEPLPDGRILLSTTGSLIVQGVSALDEDLLAFTASSLGASTAGTFALYFDGSDVDLTASGEDVDAAAVDASGSIYLSTLDLFAVTGVSGADEDVFAFTPGSLGSVTSGSYSPTLYFDGSAFGLSANDVFAIDVP